jgi:putative tricarboxylic transport membrane protein
MRHKRENDPTRERGMSQGAESSPQGQRMGGWIRAPQDFWGGLILIGIAIFAIWASGDLPGMRGFAFGPGTAPRLFAGLLVVLGAAIAFIGLMVDGPKIEKYAIRGPLLITASIFTFAAIIRPVGLIIATFLTFMISAAASKETRWLESTIMAVAMTAFCVGLFVYLLNLPFQLWPRF